jgi:hypothetical protein
MVGGDQRRAQVAELYEVGTKLAKCMYEGSGGFSGSDGSFFLPEAIAICGLCKAPGIERSRTIVPPKSLVQQVEAMSVLLGRQLSCQVFVMCGEPTPSEGR